jgi:hypothetical protein
MLVMMLLKEVLFCGDPSVTMHKSSGTLSFEPELMRAELEVTKNQA